MFPSGMQRGGEYNPKPSNPDEFDRRLQMMQNERLGGSARPMPTVTPGGILGVLFYSPYDPRSKQFVEELYTMKSLYSSITMVDVIERRNKGQKIPSIITKVPTLIINGINNPLVDDAAFHWLNIEKSKGGSQSSSAQTAAGSPATTLHDGNGFSGWCSDYNQMDPTSVCSLDTMYQPIETPRMKAMAQRVSSDSKMSDTDINNYKNNRDR